MENFLGKHSNNVTNQVLTMSDEHNIKLVLVLLLYIISACGYNIWNLSEN